MRGRWGVRRLPRLLAAPLVLTGALAALGPAAGASAANCHAVVAGQPPSPGGIDNEFLAVTVSSPCDAWAVGFDRTGSEHQTLTEHWNGASWRVVPSLSPGSGNNELSSVRAVSPTDVWAVGHADNLGGVTRVLIEHWNGSSWSLAPIPSLSGTSELSSVRAVSATNAWAVGFTIDPVSGTEQTLVLHGNGHGWARVTSPNPGPQGADDTLAGVAATAAGNAWAVGKLSAGQTSAALLLRWNGHTWSPAKLPPLGANASLTGVAATSASNAWAVGSADSNGVNVALILHWNGKAWSRVASPQPGTGSMLSSVTATSAGDALAVGNFSNRQQTLILHWNGKAWSRMASPSPGADINALTGVAASSASSAWAVGFSDTGSNPESVLALHCC